MWPMMPSSFFFFFIFFPFFCSHCCSSPHSWMPCSTWRNSWSSAHVWSRLTSRGSRRSCVRFRMSCKGCRARAYRWEGPLVVHTSKLKWTDVKMLCRMLHKINFTSSIALFYSFRVDLLIIVSVFKWSIILRTLLNLLIYCTQSTLRFYTLSEKVVYKSRLLIIFIIIISS